MLFRLLVLLCLCAAPLQAETVVAGLSQNRVSITANFDGSEILIFGAIKREAPIAKEPIEVIIAIEGPSAPIEVRKKDKRLGIWVNTEKLTIQKAPSFYAVTSTGPISEAIADTENLRHHVTIPQSIRMIDQVKAVTDTQDFLDALIRIKSKNGLYQAIDDGVRLTESTLFETSVKLPANLTEGAYKTRIFLTRDTKVVDVYETTIDVRKVGLERWIYNLAHDKPLAYGLLSLFIAIAAGWLASAFFRYIRFS
ncbi:MAG: TIGR02186 family protein [Halocynthiibacter sp.]